MLISDLITSERIVAIIGLAKNTGKTVCLGQVMRELAQRHRRLAITSIGRDGEKYDAINGNIKKPPISVPAGTLVSSTIPLFEKSNLRYRVAHTTAIRTAVGRIVVAELLEPGDVEVAGPTTVRDTRRVCETMLAAGADLALIDGALNRKATACPDLSDGVIISTGAALDRELDEVVSITREQLDMLLLPSVAEERLRQLTIDAGISALALDRRGDVVEALPEPEVSEEAGWFASMDGAVSTLVFRGALAEGVIDRALGTRARPEELTFVIRDSTKLFVSRTKWQSYEKRRVRLRVQQATKLIGLTVNPVCPESHAFGQEEFLARMKAETRVKSVFDVCSSGYQETARLLFQP